MPRASTRSRSWSRATSAGSSSAPAASRAPTAAARPNACGRRRGCALVERLRIRVAVGFDAVGAVHQLLAAHAGTRLDERYAADGIEIEVELPADRRADFEQALRDGTRGQARVSLVADRASRPAP